MFVISCDDVISYDAIYRLKRCVIKVTVHVGTDQNFEIEIFAEYKYTLNELLLKKCFSIRLIVCEM